MLGKNINRQKAAQNINVLYAAAIQDHFTKKYIGKMGFNAFTKNMPNFKNNEFQINTSNELHQQAQQIQQLISDNSQSKQNLLEKKNIIQNKKRKQKGDKLFEEMIKKCNNQDEAEQKIKQRKYNKSLSLAQKLGIIESPPHPLTIQQWEIIEQLSKQRQDYRGVCPICLDEFRMQNQIILSCSHVFHQNCLKSFEKFVEEKKCPLCRKNNYECKRIYQGSEYYLNKQATFIQKIIRGFLARKQMYELILPMSQKQIKFFQKKRVAYKLRQISQKMEKQAKKIAQKTDKFLQQVSDSSSQNNQKLYEQLEQIRNIRQNNCQDIQSKEINNTSLIDWKVIMKQAMKKFDLNDQCSICYAELFKNNKIKCLTDCGHIFHSHCISAFEHYSLNQNSYSCPICRHNYRKIQLVENNNI